jgi:hypothetical protein
MTRRKFVGLSVLGAVATLSGRTGHVNRKGLCIDMNRMPKADKLCGVKVKGGGGKDTLIAAIEGFIAGRVLASKPPEYDPIVPGADYISITMPCGKTVAYRTAKDVPDESVPCTCGNRNHWFLKYEA